MVNVEADALVGPLLSRHFRARNLIYSLAYGDQPALISELIDWASSIGMEIVAAGKGTKHREEFHWSTPDTVWEWYGIKREDAVKGGMNAKMFNRWGCATAFFKLIRVAMLMCVAFFWLVLPFACFFARGFYRPLACLAHSHSFLDGTKSAIEMAAVANACLLSVPSDGLLFPPCPTYKLPSLLKPKSDGGLLEKLGIVEVVSSLHPDGSQVDQDLRWGVYVVFKARNEYARACFREYGLQTDDSGWYASMYKPYHLIGLELGISVLNAALRKEATGSAVEWRGDVASVAKKDMEPGDELDGEGGYTVFGKLLPAEKSLEIGALPIGLAHGVRLVKGVKKGEVVTWAHVEEMKGDVVEMRREMESEFGKAKANGV